MARDINLNASCAHCGELLDTNELTRDDIDAGGELDLSGISFHVGTLHECFQAPTPHDCDEDCTSCPDCYRKGGRELCSRTCPHATA